MKPEPTFATISLPPSPSRPNDLRGIDQVLDHVYGLFGEDAILIPVPTDQVEEFAVPCPAMTAEQTRAAAYQVRLIRECIAVGCRNGLHAISFANPKVREDFLKLNPRLRESLMTAGPLVALLWVRCPDVEIPSTVMVNGFMCWSGIDLAWVVSGRGFLEPHFTILHLAKPLELPFEQIVWPEPMRVEFIFHTMEQQYGSCTTKDPQNRTILNWEFWARSFAAIHYLRYDVARESFVMMPAGHEPQLLPTERVLCLILECLTGFGRRDRFAPLLQYRQIRHLKECLAVMKIVTAQLPDPEDNLEKFLATTVETCPGADVSSAELNAVHAQYFRALKLPPYPTEVFEKRVPAYIERMFPVVRSRKIRRSGKYCRGFRHIRIKRWGGT